MGAPPGTEVNRGEEAAEMGRGALGRRHSLGEGLVDDQESMETG